MTSQAERDKERLVKNELLKQGSQSFPQSASMAEKSSEDIQTKLMLSECNASEIVIIAKIGRIISSSLLDIDEIYEPFAAEARKLISYDRIAICLHDDTQANTQTNTVTVAYLSSSGLDISIYKKGDSYLFKGSVNEIVSQTQVGLVFNPNSIEDVRSTFPSLAGSYEKGMRSMITVPLISRGEVFGGLNIRSAKTKLYTEDHLRLATLIGDQIAGAIANARFFTKLKETENVLKKTLDQLEARVRERTIELEEVNTALRVLVSKREKDQKDLADNLQANIDQLIMPFLQRLRVNESNREKIVCLSIMETNLHNIASPFVSHLSAAYRKLTSKEIQIADLIKQGKSSKDIAGIFCISVGTVATHRNNLRKKLSIRAKNVNLQSYLLSLS